MDEKIRIDNGILTQDEPTFRQDHRRMMLVFGAFIMPFVGLMLYVALFKIFQMANIHWTPWGVDFSINLGIVAARFVPYYTAGMVAIFGPLFMLICVVYAAYYFLIPRRWRQAIGTLLIVIPILFFSSNSLQKYRLECQKSYDQALAYSGQVMDFDELKQKCGLPAFYRKSGAYQYWAYTDGKKFLAVFLEENGQVKVSENPWWLFD